MLSGKYEGTYSSPRQEDDKDELMFLESSDASLNYEDALNCIKEN